MFHFYTTPTSSYVWEDGEEVIVPADATYIADWDGISPAVVTTSGTFPSGGIPYAGWPQTDVAPTISTVA